MIEAGATVGASVLDWGHVQLFSPWRYVVDAAAERLLTEAGWQAPAPTEYPTGRELVEQYLLCPPGATPLRYRIPCPPDPYPEVRTQ